MRLHYHHQQWLRDARARRWQRFHLFWPRGRAWRGIGVTVDEADEAHKAYLAGVILDRFIMPSNVTTERIRAAITDALGGGV